MARPFWQRMLQVAQTSPFLNPGGAQLGYNAYEKERLANMRTPYQIATDPRMMTGTGPGLAQVEHPQYSSAIPRGNIGEGARGVPRKEDFKNPFESLGKTADENNKFLKMLFYQSLIAGTAGDDPPQPYTVQVGPAVRPWTPINMYGRGLQ